MARPSADPATPATQRRVYLDASAGEPLLPEAREAWLAAQDAGWGDPLRLHWPGRRAAQALEHACAVVAGAVGARPDEVVFTGSGAAATQAAIAGLARGRRRAGEVIVGSAVDHSGTIAAAQAAGRLELVGVDRSGRLDLDAWQDSVQAAGVALATVQAANHEVGTLQPYAEAAGACHGAGVPLVLDATAALGRVDLGAAGPWSALTAAAGAFGGPAGVGVLVLRRGARWRSPVPTDDYQGGRWPGVPDVPAIVAAAVALQAWLADRDTGPRQFELVHRLRTAVAREVPDVDVVGDPVSRVPHLLTFSVLYVDGETITLELDRAGFAVSSGSACSANSETPSHVLAAMGALTHGNVRIGLTRTTTTGDVDALIATLPGVVAEIRSRLGAP